MTGLYAMTLSGGAAAAAALSVPVSDAAGGSWRTSLASCGLFALAAMLVWLPQLRRVHRVAAGKQRVSLWRNRTAWAITIFMAAHLPVGCAKRRPVAMGQMGSRRACAVTPSRYAPDAIVSEHAGMGCEGDQIGVVGVEVDLNQVAALLVEESYGKQSAVTELVQHSYFGGIRAGRSTPAVKALPSASAWAVDGYSASG